jgi:hypothetical protein
MENRFKSDIKDEQFLADLDEAKDAIKSFSLITVLFILVAVIANILIK